MFIHELDNWTQFVWNHEKVDAKLAEVSHALGYLAFLVRMYPPV